MDKYGFEAEITFWDPDDVPRAVQVLISHNCCFENRRDVIDDDYGPLTFARVIGTTELDDEDEFLGWLCEIIAPFDSECTEWRHARMSS
jgi:hypothetical protein